MEVTILQNNKDGMKICFEGFIFYLFILFIQRNTQERIKSLVDVLYVDLRNVQVVLKPIWS